MLCLPAATVAAAAFHAHLHFHFYCGLDGADLARLDAFEGAQYRRARASAILADGRQLEVQTYLYADPARVSDRPWLQERFALQRFLDSYCPAGPAEPV